MKRPKRILPTCLLSGLLVWLLLGRLLYVPLPGIAPGSPAASKWSLFLKDLSWSAAMWWMPFLLTLILIPYLWWRDRPWPRNSCQHCGYNLTGNTSGACPECGERA
jgi:hypothetical protein